MDSLNENYDSFIDQFNEIYARYKNTRDYSNHIAVMEINTNFALSDKIFLSLFCKKPISEILLKHFNIKIDSTDNSISYLVLCSLILNLLQIVQFYTGSFNIEDGMDKMRERILNDK